MEMPGRKLPKRILVILACACVVIIVAGTVVLTNPAKEPSNPFPAIGYEVSPTLVSEKFTSPPSGVQLSVSNASNAEYSYTGEGLVTRFNQTSSSLSIGTSSSTTANAVRFVLNASVLDDDHLMNIVVDFRVKEKSWWYYDLRIELEANMINLIPVVWLGPGTPLFQNYCFLYDVGVKGTIDCVLEVKNGNLEFGVDGFNTTLKTDYKDFTDLLYSKTTFASDSDNWSTPSDIVIKDFELANNPQIVYHDRLHKSITPGGYDFTLALQIHADYITPSQLVLMTYLSNTYGIRGVMTIWMNTSDSDEYSVDTNTSYKEDCLALQESGWEIGTHALSCNWVKRPEMLKLIAQFNQTFGPLQSWVDHGDVDQDIYLNGSNPSSPYYIADILSEMNVTMWVNLETQSHSPAQDMNLETVMYHNASFPGLDLLRVSKYGFLEDTYGWEKEFAPVTVDELANRQRIYAADDEVLIWHDYTWRFMYVQDGGVNYSRYSEDSMGYPYSTFTSDQHEAAGADIHSNGTWYIKPIVDDYFTAMNRDYKVWYATPNEVYYRSTIEQGLVVNETATSVTITNPSTSNMTDLTLFTKEKPSYCLTNGTAFYYTNKGAENYQFVIPEIPAGGSIVLSKVAPPTSGQVAKSGLPNPVVLGFLDELSMKTCR